MIKLISIIEIGDMIGTAGCIFFSLVMLGGIVYSMKNYLGADK